MKREAHKRDVGPVLVFRKDDSRAFDRKLRLSFYLNLIEEGKNGMGDPLGHGIDEGIPSHRFYSPPPFPFPLEKLCRE